MVSSSITTWPFHSFTKSFPCRFLYLCIEFIPLSCCGLETVSHHIEAHKLLSLRITSNLQPQGPHASTTVSSGIKTLIPVSRSLNASPSWLPLGAGKIRGAEVHWVHSTRQHERQGLRRKLSPDSEIFGHRDWAQFVSAVPPQDHHAKWASGGQLAGENMLEQLPVGCQEPVQRREVPVVCQTSPCHPSSPRPL